MAGLGAGVDQLILTLFPGVAAHHQHIEEALHPGFLFPLAVDVLRLMPLEITWSRAV